MINAGWVNNCGIELFTLGWVECPVDEGVNPYSAPTYPYQQALQEEEEMIMLFRSIIEIIQCR